MYHHNNKQIAQAASIIIMDAIVDRVVNFAVELQDYDEDSHVVRITGDNIDPIMITATTCMVTVDGSRAFAYATIADLEEEKYGSSDIAVAAALTQDVLDVITDEL